MSRYDCEDEEPVRQNRITKPRTNDADGIIIDDIVTGYKYSTQKRT